VVVAGSSITLQFVLGKGTTSSAIAWFSQGHFSHVDAVLATGELLGSRSDSCGSQPPGVRIRPANYEPWLKRTQFTIPCTLTQRADWLSFLLGQLGKPYDHMAIWAFASGRDWREEDSWICSELQAKALEEARIVKPLYLAANKITPVMGAMVASAITDSTYEDFPRAA
jgi:hypothetical protein